MKEKPSVHKDALVCDLVVPWHEEFLPDNAELISVMDRFVESGVDFVSLTVAAVDNTAATVELLARRRNEVLARPDKFRLVYTVADIAAARAEGRLAIGLNFQGTHPIERNTELIDLFHCLGVRTMCLAYNEKSFVGDGCHEPTNSGLSVFGRRVVKEMNRVGVIIDCSHSGERTSLDAMEISSDPVIFSHSNPRAIFEHDRNVTDEQILACAKTGGVIGVSGVTFFVGATAATIVSKMADCVAYVVDLVGPEHVALGSDFMYLEGSAYRWYSDRSYMYPTGYPAPPWDIVQPEQLPALTDELHRRGFSEDVVRGFLGANFVRVAKCVWGG